MTKKDLLLDCTMRAVAENGLMDLSMQKITEMAGTSEALIYKHYKTKEQLLLQCYLQIYKEIRDSVGHVDSAQIETTKQASPLLHKIWLNYFNLLISNNYKTIFMFEYRNSVYIKSAAARGEVDPKNFFSEIVSLFYSLDDKFGILNKIDLKTFFYYVTDISLTFAVRIIVNGMKCDKEVIENIWKLIWNGERWLLDDEK